MSDQTSPTPEERAKCWFDYWRVRLTKTPEVRQEMLVGFIAEIRTAEQAVREEERSETVAAQNALKAANRLLDEMNDKLKAARAEEREACANVADKWAACYPSEIFRDDAEDSIACMSAKHGRLVAKNIAEDVRARRGDAPEPMLDEDKRLGTSDEHGCTVAIQKAARRAALDLCVGVLQAKHNKLAKRSYPPPTILQEMIDAIRAKEEAHG